MAYKVENQRTGHRLQFLCNHTMCPEGPHAGPAAGVIIEFMLLFLLREHSRTVRTSLVYRNAAGVMHVEVQEFLTQTATNAWRSTSKWEAE